MNIFMLVVLALIGADVDGAAPTDVSSDADAGKIVATVENRHISVGDFLQAYQNRLTNVTPDEYPPMKTQADARSFLDDLITIQAILVSAYNDGYDKRPAFLKEYNAFEENILIQELMMEETKNLVVSEEEAKAFYEKNKLTRIVRYIMTENLADAQKAAAEARKKGADFKKLVPQFSIDKESVKNGGLLAEPLSYWPMEPFISLFNLPLNTVSDPIELPNEAGWGVFVVEKEQPEADSQPWEEVKDYYLNQLKEIRTNQIRERLTDQAYKEAKIERNQQNMDILYTGDSTPDDWFKDEISNLVVSTVDGLPITFREWYGSSIFYLNDIATLRKEQPAHLQKAMDYQLRVAEKGKALVSLCFKRKIKEIPSAADALRNYQEREMTFAYLKDNIEDKIPEPTEEQIKAYYEAHKKDAEFQLVENLDATLLRGNKKEYVDEAIARLGKGEDQDTVVKDINKRAGVDLDKLDRFAKPENSPILDCYPQNFLSTNADIKDQYELIKNLGEGKWSETTERDKSFYSTRLDKINPTRTQTLEEVRSVITNKLSDEIRLDPKTDRMCRDLLKKIHDRYPIKIHNEVLELARKRAAAIPFPKPAPEEGVLEPNINSNE